MMKVIRVKMNWALIFVLIVISYCLAIPAAKSSSSLSDAFIFIFGGIPLTGSLSDIDSVSLGRWMLLIAPIGFMLIDADIHGTVFYLLRYGSFKVFLASHYIYLVFHSLSYFVIIAFALLSTSFFISDVAIVLNPESCWVVLLCVIHYFFLAVLTSSLVMLSKRYAFAVVGTVAEGLCLIIASLNPYYSKWVPGVWGMYLRSDLHISHVGFPHVIAMIIQIIFVVASFITQLVIFKRKGFLTSQIH